MNATEQQHELDLINYEETLDRRETVLFNAKMESKRVARELRSIDVEIEYYKQAFEVYHNL
jgi:hypothetical protein